MKVVIFTGILTWEIANSVPPGSTTVGKNAKNVNAYEGNSSISANFLNTLPVGTISTWIITPSFTLSYGLNVTFYTISNGGFPDRLEIRFSAVDSVNTGTTADSVGDFRYLLYVINPSLTKVGYPKSWTRFELLLNATNAIGRVAFRYYVTDGGPEGVNSDFISIDSVSISPLPINGVCGPTTTGSTGTTSSTTGTTGTTTGSSTSTNSFEDSSSSLKVANMILIVVSIFVSAVK